ncbi:hypothetical protein GQ43DRAFT_430586 [Delitschia confertaspora ATCC 74209]|uniref:HPP transmembrane region domain-containing protein n=1 Tax=Delitschia confertaspora ATCC 74209 TaxID=1513339 RepID=A0A9P4JNF7_9PLEO|nr:hypothetical protein GQ43DRAFT_430586 [Delitschia confertaspora ATCC 74209]
MLSRAVDWNFDIDRYINRVLRPSPLHKLPTPVSRFLGYRKEPKKDVGNILGAIWSFVGAFCGLAVIVAVFNNTESIQRHHPPVLIASFGASAVLEYNVIRSPLGQPRNALLGHTFSALVGVAITKLFLYHHDFERIRWIAGSVACGLASAVMLLTNTVHPPGGASALLAAVLPEVTDMGWYFVGLIMFGTVLMLFVSLVVNNIQRQFPLYWVTAVDLRSEKDVKQEHLPDGDGAIEPKKMTEVVQGVDEIRISERGVELPSALSLNPEEAELLERLRKRLRAIETKDGAISLDTRRPSSKFTPRTSKEGVNNSDSSTLVISLILGLIILCLYHMVNQFVARLPVKRTVVWLLYKPNKVRNHKDIPVLGHR